MNFQNVQPVGWVLLALSFLGAVLVDYGCHRLLLEFLRPPSAWIFWVGRVGKIAGLLAWIYFFNCFWYPQILGGGQTLPTMVSTAETATVVLVTLFALLTVPRPQQRKKS